MAARVFQAENSTHKGSSTLVSLAGICGGAVGEWAEMAYGGNEAAEVFGGQIPSFSESVMDINRVVTHRKSVK